MTRLIAILVALLFALGAVSVPMANAGGTTTKTPTKSDSIYKKPFVALTRLSCRCAASDDSCSPPGATEPSLTLRPLMLPASLPNPPGTPKPPRALLRSNLKPFQPSSSLSNLSPLSRSSLSSRSARFAVN